MDEKKFVETRAKVAIKDRKTDSLQDFVQCGDLLGGAISIMKPRIRERYWTVQSYLEMMGRLLHPSKWNFARHVASDYFRFLTNGVCPISGETRKHARAAMTWLIRAQDATPDDGVSFGYFPCDSDGTNGWRPSYPETTGYIIPSLLEYSERFKNPEIRERALRMAFWETMIQMPSGAVQGGPVCLPAAQEPAVFNTGMVLHGYTAAFRATEASVFLVAARRAGDFLLADLRDDGHFQTLGKFVSHHQYKTYNCLCAWPLFCFGQDTGEERYQKAAIRIIEAAIQQQDLNGWFCNNCLMNSDAPISHTICYTLQGILEVGLLAGRDDFVASAQRGAEPLLPQISPDGFLYGSFRSDWTPSMRASCLTGNAQLAVVCYRLYEHTRDTKYKLAADSLVNYLKALQVLDSEDPGLDGGIPGSFPLLGSYMRIGYPNWATKYFLDALLLQDRLQKAEPFSLQNGS